MNSRKDDRLTSINLGLSRTAKPELQNQIAAQPSLPPRVMAGAVGAMSRSLDQFQEELRAAQSLVAQGYSIVEIETDRVHASFLMDRLDTDFEAEQALLKSMQELGQQVPILVRPHPEIAQHYQVAYGHRRLAACRTLGRKVQAIIRMLDDNALLLAQGQENSNRQNLSFIERALFALKLEQHGLKREAIMTALAVDKAEVSKLIAVAASIPGEIIAAIGSAPKAGRPRWIRLAQGLSAISGKDHLMAAIQAPGFMLLATDERFTRALAAVRAPLQRGNKSAALSALDGSSIGLYQAKATKLTIAFDEGAKAGFARHLIDLIPELYESYWKAAKPKPM